MIRARCLHRSGCHSINTNIKPNSPSSARPLQKVSSHVISVIITTPTNTPTQFYSAGAGASLRHGNARNQLLRTSKARKSPQWPLQPLNGILAPRFASTTPVPPPVAEEQPAVVPPPQASTSAEGESLLPPLDEMTDPISPPVYEHLGFLKEMGLDYGWGPTSLVQTMLEHVHVYLGTPWWASIGITVLIFRAALFKFYINAADISARRALIKHLETPLVERMQAARAEGDTKAVWEARKEIKVLHKAAGIKPWTTFVPFLQLPIGFGTFRLMRGMATLPVPGFDTGGLLWVSDLTTPDPYYILPMVTAYSYYLAFKVPILMVEFRQTD